MQQEVILCLLQFDTSYYGNAPCLLHYIRGVFDGLLNHEQNDKEFSD